MTLVLLNDDADPQLVTRVPQGEARREQVLRDLIYDNPTIMPVHELDPTNSGRLTLTVMGNTQARVDLDRWQQVLTNLLGNALTHGHAGSPIKVTLDGRNAHMVDER